MRTMKKFLKYAIWIILFYLLTEGLVYISTKDRYKEITDFELITQSPVIEVSKFESSYTNGYIEGNVTNDTGEYIKKNYLKVDFYNKDNSYIGTEYQELKNFNATEKMNFDIYYEYMAVESAKFSMVNESEANNSIKILNDDNYEYQKWWPIVGICTLLYVI